MDVVDKDWHFWVGMLLSKSSTMIMVLRQVKFKTVESWFEFKISFFPIGCLTNIK